MKHGVKPQLASSNWGQDTPLETILARVNAQLGKTQRLNRLIRVDALPRSQIGKVLKRHLKDQL